MHPIVRVFIAGYVPLIFSFFAVPVKMAMANSSIGRRTGFAKNRPQDQHLRWKASPFKWMMFMGISGKGEV
jgi:hypothetical protein